ncbi:hypothetical protein TIFTF001_048373 [Ficus carica]|uniref:Uncharacterized protein n=1 Tax=Ficus carica TaxID=3494 RepID=A0AA88DDM5_FICCA|nr:hypothetical protein TIFTF001_048373 [Ficus carica]
MRVEVRVEIGFLYRYEIELRDGGFGTKVGDQDRVSGRTSGSSFWKVVRQIMDNLEEMFGEQIIQAKTDAIKGLMNYKQKVGTPIKEHMMKIMAYLSEAQANGTEIDVATQLVMVFQTLSKDFDLFQASYNLNRKEMSLTELMK